MKKYYINIQIEIWYILFRRIKGIVSGLKLTVNAMIVGSIPTRGDILKILKQWKKQVVYIIQISIFFFQELYVIS